MLSGCKTLGCTCEPLLPNNVSRSLQSAVVAGEEEESIRMRLFMSIGSLRLLHNPDKNPGVEESTAYGSPALKIQGKLLAFLPAHRSAEPGSLVVRVGFDDRAELLAADPDVYYVTDHYLNYTSVLVRLSRVTPDVLRDLLGMAHKFVTARRA